MEKLLLVLPLLACPLVMGACMWMMARGMRGDHAKDEDPKQATTLAELCGEQERIAARIGELEEKQTAAAPGRTAAYPG